MKTKNLLQYRYKVIADYPGCGFRIGTILSQEYGSSAFNKWINGLPISNISVYTPEKWPHIFKKIEWWEEREEKDMPEYVTWRSCNSGRKYVAKILEIKDDKFRWKEGWETFTKDQDFPATKEEYENAAPL